MTTQTQGGKGKKKNKDAVKLSLDEFNNIDAPIGHAVVSLKATGLDWAAAMEDHNSAVGETHQYLVPTAPRAQRGPGVDIDSLPNEPPFKVSLFNLPMTLEEKEITDRFFQGLSVLNVDTSSKSSTSVEFETRQDMYEALCKDGTSYKNRTVSVCIFGQSPPNNDRYGGRGSGGHGDRYGDRYNSGSRYGDRSGGFGRDRDNYTGYNRGGAGGGGYGQRSYGDRDNFRSRDNNRGQYTSGGGESVSEDPADWRARPATKSPTEPAPYNYNNGSRSYQHSRQETSHHHYSAPTHNQQYNHSDSYYQPSRSYNQPQNYSPYPHQSNNQNNYNSRPMASSGGASGAPDVERKKLVLNKRKTPVNVDDVSAVSRNEAIFGQAKPSAKPYEKMKEVEEKLKSVQITDKPASQSGSQGGSRPGSAPRSRRVSSNHSESNNN